MLILRRFYLYLASGLSLLLVLSGGIAAAKLWFSNPDSAFPSDQLALSLAYILVGLPALIWHWSLLQRRIRQNPDEAAAPERVLFLYSILLTTLFTVILNVLALVNQFILSMLGVPVELALLGTGQTLTEWLATILLCSIAAAYFFHILQQDASRRTPDAAWKRVREGYRYNWLLFSLGLLLIGLQQTVQFILELPLISGAAERAALGNGLAFILIAAPLWVTFERAIQKSSSDPVQRSEEVQLSFNSGIYLILSTGLLFCLAAVVSASLQALFQNSTAQWLVDATLPLSIGIPLAAIWFTYQRSLRNVLSGSNKDPFRSRLKRTLYYSFAWIGLVAALAGFLFLINNLISLALQSTLVQLQAWSAQTSQQIARSISAVAIGLPLWFYTWRKVSSEAKLDSEIGETARQARSYQLYLSAVVLIGLAGVIASTVWLVYQIARAILDGLLASSLLNSLAPAATLLVFALLLAYHWKIQQGEQRQVARAHNRRYALFPVLILVPETLPTDQTPPVDFGTTLAVALEREMPGLPIAMHVYTSGAPDETLSAAKAVIIPSRLLTRPPESISLWLQGYNGAKLVIPEASRDWHWFGADHNLAYLARRAARKIRVLAENSGSRRS